MTNVIHALHSLSTSKYKYDPIMGENNTRTLTSLVFSTLIGLYLLLVLAAVDLIEHPNPCCHCASSSLNLEPLMCFVIVVFRIWTDVCGTCWLYLGQALAAESAEVHPSAA